MTLTPGVAVAGIGETGYSKRGTSPHGEIELALMATLEACADAGVDPRTIDGFASFGHDPNDGTKLAASLGIAELRWSSMVWGSGGGGIAGSVAAAAAAIMSGQARRVVVVRALAERSSGRLGAAVSAHAMNAHYRAAGIISPAQTMALRVQRLFEHDGVPPETQRAVAQACYHHARRNPRAVGRDIELDDATYAGSRWIAEPFRLFDCSRESDGAAALLFVASEDARSLRRPPVYLTAAAASAPRDWGERWENEGDYSSAGFALLARRLWDETGLTPQDIDVVQAYENFTGAAVAALIDHGFCTRETAGEVLRLENLIAPSGALPINTSGGNVGEGFVHGIGLVVEAARQIRGESCSQVPDARYSMLLGGPGDALVSSAIFSSVDPAGAAVAR